MEKASSKLELLRDKIDQLDIEIVNLIAKRLKISQKIGQYKNQHRLKIVQNRREQRLLSNRAKIAKKLKLKPEFIKAIFKVIIQQSRKEQLLLTKKPKIAKI